MTRLLAGTPGLYSGRDKNFSLHNRVQTASGAHPASCSGGTGSKTAGP